MHDTFGMCALRVCVRNQGLCALGGCDDEDGDRLSWKFTHNQPSSHTLLIPQCQESEIMSLRACMSAFNASLTPAPHILLFSCVSSEPLYANAEGSCWWELMLLAKHSHPSVAAFARRWVSTMPYLMFASCVCSAAMCSAGMCMTVAPAVLPRQQLECIGKHTWQYVFFCFKLFAFAAKCVMSFVGNVHPSVWCVDLMLLLLLQSACWCPCGVQW
jgi:hypothetical protein